MAKTIQRPKKSKSTNNEVITNLGTNQNVVKVIIDTKSPDKEKPRKKPRKKKVDKEKQEAIAELREALGEYDDEQTKAQKLGIKIPSELGMTSIKSDEIKTTDDILRFINLIREKKAQIQALEQTKPEPERLNRFLTRDVPIRQGQFSPFIPVIEPQRQIEQQVRPQPQVRPQRQVQQTDFDTELRGLQENVSLPSTPDELKFEDVITKLQAGLRTISTDIQLVRERGNGKLTLEQIRNFKSRYEQVRKILETSFNKLPEKSQNKLQNVFSDFETSINEENEKLAVIERQSLPPLPPVPPPPKQPRQLRRPLELQPPQPPQPPQPQPPQPPPAQPQPPAQPPQSPEPPGSAPHTQPPSETVVPESQGVVQPQEEEIDADREADIQLLKRYVNQTPPLVYWSSKLRNALSRLGATQKQISDIGEISTAPEKRNAVKNFLLTIGVRTEQASLDQSFLDTLTQLDMEIGVVENAYENATREENTEYLKSLQSKGEELKRALNNLSSEEEKAIARPLVNESIEKSEALQLNINIQPYIETIEQLMEESMIDRTNKKKIEKYIGDIATAWDELQEFVNGLNESERKVVLSKLADLEVRKDDVVNEMRQLIDV